MAVTATLVDVIVVAAGASLVAVVAAPARSAGFEWDIEDFLTAAVVVVAAAHTVVLVLLADAAAAVAVAYTFPVSHI